ncbi:hypothetical protein SCG7086_BT_00030 [Chlamydiales bacterium SCGC AG-110-P3]|nr:hypothetical protein SCG7086_BT_00030 [Chlamydiales bacterium SCGC AG-110-P3]
MGLGLAFKAFFRAFKDPKAAKKFLQPNDTKKITKKEEDASHLQLLMLLQKSGRLIDFLQEDLSGCTDAQIGAAAKKVQQDCCGVLEELVTVRPVFEDREGASIQIPAGYDVSAIKVVGNVKGDAPYKGVLVHKGWRAHKRSLPKRVGHNTVEVLCQAEVEVK